jgi:hypothetical protein
MQRILIWLRQFFKHQDTAANPLDVLPDFQNFPYLIAIEPVGSHINAWIKLREAERRLTMYKWVEQYNDPANPQHRVLLNDSWFGQQSQNDIYVKGLRTLRHFEAHVEVKTIARTVNLHIKSSIGGKKSGAEMMGCTWHLPKLTETDLKKLYNSPLSDTDIDDWNTLVMDFDVKTIFMEGLSRLKGVLETAEMEI